MEIDLFDDDSFIATGNDGFNTSDSDEFDPEKYWDQPPVEGPDIVVDATVVADAPFVEEPFIEEPVAPAIDLGVPQIGVPVFTLDPVVGTDPVSDIMGGEDVPQ